MRDKVKELRDEIEKLEAQKTPAGNLAMGVVEAPAPTNCQVLVRGEIKDKGAEVPRGVLTVLKTPAANRINPRHSGRLELAQWIASKSNPLTARVMANRVWSHLLGHGLVESVDNFGSLGSEPSNPELLDALAFQFMNEGWSVKKLIRSIVLSHTYQLSSEHNAVDYEHDPANIYLWRVDRRRLDAEEIRDAMLLACGQLNVERPSGSLVMDLDNGPVRGRELQEVHKATNVRSIYLPIVRGNLPDFMQVFDAADPSLIVGKRDVTTVPTQALFLMNNPFVLRQAEEMAKRILKDKDRDQSTRIDMAYRLALCAPGHEGRACRRGQVPERLPQENRRRKPQGQPAGRGLDQPVPDACSSRVNSATRTKGVERSPPETGPEHVRKHPSPRLLPARPVEGRFLRFRLFGVFQSRRTGDHFGRAIALAPKAPHFKPRAKRVIFLFMQGRRRTSTLSITSRACRPTTAKRPTARAAS